MIKSTVVRDCVVAGLLAGFALAALFFFYDLGQGAPLRTPAFLWGAIVNRSAAEPTTGAILGFTIIHFVAWGGLGLLAGTLIRWANLPRNILIGAVYGLFACSFVFYLGLVRAPDDLILSAPDWPAVFFGNALAGIVMFTYLHWRSAEPGVVGFSNFLETHDVTRRGLTAGLIGAVVVAVWFLIMDAILRQPLFTPAALASVLFHGGSGPADVQIAFGPVLGYTLAHFAFFVLFGVVLSGISQQVAKFPPLALGVLVLFVLFEVFFVAMDAVLGRWVLAELAWWSVLAGNVLAAVAMGSYLWKAYPELRERVTDEAVWAS